MLKNLLFVAMGGAVGAMLRYGISSGIYAWFGRAFPYGTLVVNVAGSFAIGLLSILLVERFNVPQEWRAGCTHHLLNFFLGHPGLDATGTVAASVPECPAERGSLYWSCMDWGELGKKYQLKIFDAKA